MTFILPLAGKPGETLDSNLIELLAAFQFLQSQNLQLATHLSNTMQIGPTDLRVMLIIHSNTIVTPKDLAIRLDHTTGSITALVDRLEKAGHLERRRHPTDRRSQTLHLTATGTQAVRELRDVYATAFDGLFTGNDLTAATQNLRTLGNALTPYLPETTNPEPAQ